MLSHWTSNEQWNIHFFRLNSCVDDGIWTAVKLSSKRSGCIGCYDLVYQEEHKENIITRALLLKSATQPDCAGGVIWRWYWCGASWALGFLVFYCTKNHLPRPNFESPADKGMSDDGEPNMETGNYIWYIYIRYNIIHNIYIYVCHSIA